MDYSEKIIKELVQLARLALTGKQHDVQLFVRRLAIRYRDNFPELSHQLGELARRGNGTGSILRGTVVEAIPVDIDSRLQLARPEYPVNLEVEPHWPVGIREQLGQLIDERKMAVQLMEEDLQPTRTALFTGPPGVGKTLAARWVARELDQPLIVLDLAAVMSSFLGRTGNNVRNVLDYAKGTTCVLLLDEFDALAKRRDDAVEIGELKRLVTVLLQEIDQWPASGLLIAATNHKELLDPAVWRRFEAIIDFTMPSEEDVRRTVGLYLSNHNGDGTWTKVLTKALQGLSYGEIEREIRRAQRQSVIKGQPLDAAFRRIIEERATSFSKRQRYNLALALIDVGLSQREAHTLTGVSRDTIRKHQEGRSEHDARK
jgi:hypothetical protein